jgi:predicted kinase
MDLVILIGLQGAGKSSFYRACLAGTHNWVSKDRFGSNRNPARRQRQLLEETLGAGCSAVVDNTNATKEDRRALIELGRAFGARIIGYYFESRLADCLERKRLELPSRLEGFDQLFFVRLLGDSRFEVLDWNEGGGDDAAR